MKRRMILSGATALVVLLSGVGAPSAVAAADTTVMTWNIAGGAIDAGADRWASHVSSGLADLVGMQEVCWYQVDDIEENLEAFTGDDWVSNFGVADTTSWSCPGHFGQAMFVKASLQPRDWDNRPFPKENGCDGDAEERAFQSVTVTLGGTAVRVFNTHMATEGNADCQVPVLIQAAVQWPNSIVMGDFNLRPNHSAMAQWTTSGFRNLHPDTYYTVSNDPENCDHASTIKFDYVWVRGTVRKDWDLNPMCNDASDHRALLAGVVTP